MYNMEAKVERDFNFLTKANSFIKTYWKERTCKISGNRFSSFRKWTKVVVILFSVRQYYIQFETMNYFAFFVEE